MNDADKKLLELAEKAKRPMCTCCAGGGYGSNCSCDVDRYLAAAANAVPRLIAEKDALLARIERLRNVMSDQAIEFSKPSATTEALRKKWTEDVLAADDAAAKEHTDD